MSAAMIAAMSESALPAQLAAELADIAAAGLTRRRRVLDSPADRIARVDGKPMGAAGLWECWTGADGEVIVSFCLLTVNANSHALMHRYGPPGSEKRMVAILNEGAYGAWLNAAQPEKAREFMRAYAANWLTANPVEKK